MSVDPQTLYVQLGRLVETMPSFEAPLSPETHRWLGRVSALIAETRDPIDITQSLKDFAGRSPASIVRVDDETAALKVAAYGALWLASTPLQ